jgi:hypothetical protein
MEQLERQCPPNVDQVRTSNSTRSVEPTTVAEWISALSSTLLRATCHMHANHEYLRTPDAIIR